MGEGKPSHYYYRRSGENRESHPGAGQPGSRVERVEFCPLPPADGPAQRLTSIEHFAEMVLTLSAELGKAQIKVGELIQLERGSLIKLNRLADESVVLLANGSPLTLGEVVVINDRFGVRITSFISDSDERSQGG